MIDFKCPKCGTEMSSPHSLAGQMETCPSCRDKIRVPHPGQQEPRGVRTVEPPLGAAPASSGTKACPYCGEDIKQAAIVCRFCGMNLATGETAAAHARNVRSTNSAGRVQVAEQTLWEGNPTHWGYLGRYIFAVILIPVLIGIPLLIWAILDRKHTVYTVTNKRAIQQRGIIGRALSEVDLKDIRNVIVQYGILDRLVGCGNVGLATAGHAGIEIKMRGCKNPEQIRRLIVDVKERAQQLPYGTE